MCLSRAREQSFLPIRQLLARLSQIPGLSLGFGWGWSPYRTVHVGFSPDDVVVVVDDHGPAEHMQVLHDIFLDVCQRGDLSVVAFVEKQKCEAPC